MFLFYEMWKRCIIFVNVKKILLIELMVFQSSVISELLF